MKWRQAAVLGLLALVALALVVFFCTQKREPVYEGKPLSYWLLVSPEGPNGAAAEKNNAIHAIGSNAVPFLVRWESYERPWVWEAVQSVSGCRFDRPQQELAIASVDTFEILGSRGASAIPQLSQLMKSTNSSVAFHANYSMAAIGKEGVPALLDVVTNRHAYIPDRSFVPFIGGSHWGADGIGLVVPILVQSLKDKDTAVAVTAAAALRVIGPLPGVVKALTNAVEAADADLRQTAVYALGAFGADSIPATPCLVRALRDPEIRVRQEATNSLATLSYLTMGIVKRP